MLRQTTVVLLTAAVLAPAAGAGRYSIAAPPPVASVSRPSATCHQYCGIENSARNARTPARPVVVRTRLVPASDGGFHWLDAGVGFSVAVVSAAIVLLVLAQLPRRRSRIGHAEGTS